MSRCDGLFITVFAWKTPKNEGIRTFAQFTIALGKPMKKEWKKTKSKRRTTLTAWVSRTERCSVVQLTRCTKHIPRRQKVVTVGNFRTGSDGSGSAALDRVCGASGMTLCSRFHFLCCASVASCKHTAAERTAATLCHDQVSVIVWTSNFTLKGKTQKVCQKN